LALSGGGFRATLFHLGAGWRLIELGILTRVARISSVSGGSIFAGVLAANWTALAGAADPGKYQDLVVKPLRRFCQRSIDAPAIGEGIFMPWKNSGDLLEADYRTLFDTSLDKLPDSPAFIFNSTNLQTGRDFRFAKAYMGDYRIGLIRGPTLPLARAVASSSAFPPFLSPVVIDNPGKFEPVEGADLNGHPEFTNRLYLSDGGVYDNLGLETVWNRCETVLSSDAGAPFGLGDVVETDWVRQTLRALDVATDQSRGLRKRALVADYQSGARKGCYWGIDTVISAYKLEGALRCDNEIVKPLSRLRTRLNPFNDTEQDQLINWGYAICDAAVRKYAPELVAAQTPASWPCPAHPLG
jgi:NTE family protein